ncbi:MAG: hypothetical protein IEMM0003_0570 [bacterium]|nr:MAG: hypothetical protein IEMM0003_0570 [bacterium]
MKIVKEVILSKKEHGRYKAFPTIVKVDDEIVAAYREGFVDSAKPHGSNGCVKILKSRDLNRWDETETPFCDNELDAVISRPFGDYLFLATRSYEYKKRNDVYISKFKANELPAKRSLIKFDNADFTMFGHIIENDGVLTAPAYGTCDGINSPILLSSDNFGQTWNIKSLITPNGHKPVLNETSIVMLDDKFLAIMRSQEPSYNLYCAFSEDLINWSKPENLGILGHAPMIRKLDDGRIVFVFRDLNDSFPGVGLAISKDGLKWDRFNICHYTGNLYNGGYADFVEIEPNVLFIVYYTCDEDNEPWIEGKVIKI